MNHLCLKNWELLKGIDYKIAVAAKAQNCPDCQGKLDWASFPRKPRGLDFLSDDRRFSLCCRQCRHRVTPASVRFLWRKIYISLVVALGSEHGGTELDRRTLGRWRLFWKQHLSVDSLFCQHFRHRLPVAFSFSLTSMIASFSIGTEIGLILMARFLSPLGCAPKLRFIKFCADDAR
jgi:hypothetical protein